MKKLSLLLMVLLAASGFAWSQAAANVNTQTQTVNVTIGAASGGGTYQEGLNFGKQVAKGNGLYFFSGCLLGVIGIVIPAVVEPEVPMEMVMGRSAEYIQGFRQSYISESKKKNVWWSVGGCAASSAATGILYVVYFGAMLGMAGYSF